VDERSIDDVVEYDDDRWVWVEGAVVVELSLILSRDAEDGLEEGGVSRCRSRENSDFIVEAMSVYRPG
jgi:hypothetical protein